MASVSTKGNNFALVLGEREFNDLSLDPNKEYEFFKVKKGIWVVLEKNPVAETIQAPIEKKEKPLSEKALPQKKVSPEDAVKELLKTKSLQDRVEEKFEHFLTKDQLTAFYKLIKEGTVIRFRLDKSYKKAVYKLREDAEKDLEKGIGEELNKDELNENTYSFDIDKDGFVVFSSEVAAKKFSYEHQTELKEKTILGMKSFDGNCYFVKETLYEKASKVLLDYLTKNKTAYLSELSKIVKSDFLAKLVCEFLKEEGLIIEKKKELYEAID